MQASTWVGGCICSSHFVGAQSFAAALPLADKTKQNKKKKDLDTSPTLVCPLIPHYVNFLILCGYREVTLTSQMHLEVQIKSGHLAWVRKEQTSKQINLQHLFNDYWATTADEITLQGPSWSTPSLCI